MFLVEHPFGSVVILGGYAAIRTAVDIFWYPEDYRMQEWWRPWLEKRGLLFAWMKVDYTKDC